MGLLKGRFQNDWPNRIMAWPIIWKMKYAFSKRFCWKTISFVHAIQELIDLAGKDTSRLYIRT